MDIISVWFIVVMFIIVLVGFIGGSLFLRWLADNGWFLVRPLEMHAVVVLKDKNVYEVIIACSDPEKSAQLRKIGNQKFKFVSEGKLIWIGLLWTGHELYGWYENSRDDDDPETDPHYTLYLGERTWDYATPEPAAEEENKQFISEWGVDTADPVQVVPKLVVTIEVIDPLKALFKIAYFHEAIQKLILTEWKKAVQTLEYFTYEDADKKDPAGKTGTLQIDAQSRLNQLLGLHEDKTKNKFEYYSDGTPAKIIYDGYGVWLKRVEIRDIDPTDPTIRENLQKKIKAQTEAAAKVETAKGNRDAKKIEADGKVYDIVETGKASANAILAMYDAKAYGFNSISQKLELSKEDNKILFAAEMAIDMAKNSNYTYLAGMPQDIRTWLLAAADQMKGGVEKIKSGAKTEAKVGFEEIKTIWSSLTPKQQKEFLKITEKKGGGKHGQEKDDAGSITK